MTEKIKFEEMLKKYYREKYSDFSYAPGPDCLSDELISVFAAGECSQEEKSKIKKHISGCKRCLFLVGQEFKKNRASQEKENMRFCLKCQKVNTHNEKFCQYCGSEIPVRLCVFCERPVRKESKFCPHCGKKIFIVKTPPRSEIDDIAEMLPDDVENKDALASKIAEAVHLKEEARK